MRKSELWPALQQAGSSWLEHKAARSAAALAYYALLSLAPLLVISVASIGFFVGPDAARGRVAGELARVVGAQAALSMQTAIASARAPGVGLSGTLLGVLMLLFGASGVFNELQESLNTVWSVQPKPGRGLTTELRERFVSFVMVLGVAFLLLVSVLVSSLLSAVGALFASALPGGELLWQLLNAALWLGVVTSAFALLLRTLPDAQIEWRSAWAGATLTGILFTLGKLLLGLYLGKAAFSSLYGVAGSVIALVVWVYYAAQILLLGAEFTRTFALRSSR